MSKQIYVLPIGISPTQYHFDVDNNFNYDTIYCGLIYPHIFRVDQLPEQLEIEKDIEESLKSNRVDYFFNPLRAIGRYTKQVVSEEWLSQDPFNYYLRTNITIFKNNLSNKNIVTNESLLYMVPKNDELIDADTIARVSYNFHSYEALGDFTIMTYTDILKEIIDGLDWNIQPPF